MTTLIEQLETAREGSRELDAEIARVLGYEAFDRSAQSFGDTWCMKDGDAIRDLPRWSSNLQDTVDLVPEGWAWELSHDRNPAAKPPWSTWEGSAFIWEANHDPNNPRTPSGGCKRAATPQLALCAAIVRAKSST